MAANQAKIVLTNPCSENWNSMQAGAIGHFCHSCQKNVIDLTSQSDNEIRSFLKDKQGEKLCGRFHIHQVERIRIEIDQKLLVSNIPFWQKFLVVVLVCFGQDFLGVDFAFAQTEMDSIAVKTEQVDSLISSPATEVDSTLEVLELTVDSLQKPFKFKHSEIEWITLGSMIHIEIMGMISIVNEPEWDIPSPFDQNQPKEDDTTVSKTGIATASKNNPVVPKRPRKKPSPPENAVIADDDRRKTRRS